jgi:hypothetical protein
MPIVLSVTILRTGTQNSTFPQFSHALWHPVSYIVTISVDSASIQFFTLRTITSFFDKSEGWACTFDIHMGSFKISTGPRPSLLCNNIRSLARLWHSVSQSVSQPLDIIPREDQAPPCSCCLNAIYLAITEHPSPCSTVATLTFNLENCLPLVVCFHYCQLFRSLCTDSLCHNPWLAGLQWRFYALRVSDSYVEQLHGNKFYKLRKR